MMFMVFVCPYCGYDPDVDFEAEEKYVHYTDYETGGRMTIKYLVIGCSQCNRILHMEMKPDLK